MGAPDWASLHDIKLDWYHHPSQHLCFACYRCHHLFGLARTPKSLKSSWSNLITHMSGGLLFGREVPPPPSFGILRANQPYSIARPSPRRDELENYLANTDLPLHEIARRMQWTYGSVKGAIPPIYRRRNVKGREALKQWWANNSPANANARAA